MYISKLIHQVSNGFQNVRCIFQTFLTWEMLSKKTLPAVGFRGQIYGGWDEWNKNEK